jgi:hypothetical protein
MTLGILHHEDRQESESEGYVISTTDMFSTDHIPSDTHTDQESNGTDDNWDQRKRGSMIDIEKISTDDRKYHPYCPTKWMRNYSTMEYMIDIRDESDQIDNDREEDEYE